MLQVLPFSDSRGPFDFPHELSGVEREDRQKERLEAAKVGQRRAYFTNHYVTEIGCVSTFFLLVQKLPENTMDSRLAMVFTPHM